MAATTISRTWYDTLVDDSGGGGDGTIIDKADFDAILDAVDALFTSTTGITLNQGTGDGPILTAESSDVAHGMTTLVPTEAYLAINKITSTTGGVEVRGFTTATKAVQLLGHQTTENTTKSTAGTGPISLQSWTKSGTTVAAVGANSNVLVVQPSGVTRFILDADGDSHQDVGTAWTNFDDHEDVELLHALSAGVSPRGDPLRRQFKSLLEKYKPALTRARIVTFNKDGHHFINWSRTHMLVIGAVRQQAMALAKTQAQVRRLQKRLA